VDALTAGLAAHTLAPSPESLLHADYQKWNAALALAVVRGLAPAVDEEAVLRAFANARLLGRFWKVEEEIYADIAHNAEKIDALSGEIRKQFGDAGKIVVVGISGQRVSTKVFRALAEIAHTIIVTSASFKGQDPARCVRKWSRSWATSLCCWPSSRSRRCARRARCSSAPAT
jgi:folylpolyglutamate synthase/dihydropteroate synthase